MYNNILQSIDNIAIWPMISFVIFFLFFLCLLWYVFTADKGFINTMKELPLNDGVKNSSTTINPR
ncbi:MAG: cbb3-type cytochrome c oxidase subunit 3 [Cyclobacteriaceae bacterium]|nr:cbb3-type cytochrome c oxidase subunit 3 [Cyclobacteriaceae bacterium]